MKLINLLIRELNNCSLGGDFRVSLHAGIREFDHFSLQIHFKRGTELQLWKSQTRFKLKQNTIDHTKCLCTNFDVVWISENRVMGQRT